MVQSLWSQHGALNHLPSLVYLLGRIQHISCWFHQVPITAGWAEAPWDEKFAQHFYTWVTVLPYQPCHQQPCHHYRLPPWVNHVWRLPCHHIYIATISQTRLTIALPPSVKHGWRLPCHQSDTADFCLATSQTRLTFVLSPTSQTRLTFALPPPVRHGWLLPCHQCLERLVPLSLMF